jgi:phospholipase C
LLQQPISSESGFTMRNVPDQHKFDHVVTVLFENRSFDNLLGRLYEPGEVSAFEGVVGMALSNPIPAWAEHGAECELVPYGVAANIHVPNPDCWADFAHVNRQLFGATETRRGQRPDWRKTAASFNLPADPQTVPTMDGFVTDYIGAFTAEIGRQPTYPEYAQIMTGYAPQQVPVISTIARGFATFDHWFCDVPSETLTNRSFCHAGTASGFVVDTPYANFPLHNDAETIFERLDAAGLTWRVYVDPCMRCSVTGMIHATRLAEQFATNFSTLDDFFEDADDGRLPAYSFIEPCLMHAHNDYHPASGDASIDTASSVLGGEDLLARIYTAVRTSSGDDRSNFANTLLLVGFDEHGGMYDHVVPPGVDPPDSSAPAGQMGFRFDRAGLRIPAVAVSAYIEPRTVITTEYRNTSIIRTLRARWPLGPPLTARDATASDITPILTRSTPRPPEDWPDVTPRTPPRLQRAQGSLDRRLPPMGRTLLGVVMELDTHHTGHVPDLDPETATATQAANYLNERSPRLWPGLYAHAA